MRPTAQNIPLLLYVHHTIAAQLTTYPPALSIGATIPTRLVKTRGRRQYPRTEALRGKVRELAREEEEEEDDDDWWLRWWWWWWRGEEEEESGGGDIRLKIVWRDREPMRARP